MQTFVVVVIVDIDADFSFGSGAVFEGVIERTFGFQGREE